MFTVCPTPGKKAINVSSYCILVTGKEFSVIEEERGKEYAVCFLLFNSGLGK